jgi:hypothetical protein
MIADYALGERGGLAPDAPIVPAVGPTDRGEQSIGVDDAGKPTERERLFVSVDDVSQRDAVVASSYRFASRLSASE